MPKRAIQIGMGVALLVAAGFLFAKLSSADAVERRRDPRSSTGRSWPSASSGSFFLGAIMPLGIGYYAPCMILVALLGMNPLAAFPIMMGACAFLMPVASMKFVRSRAV